MIGYQWLRRVVTLGKYDIKNLDIMHVYIICYLPIIIGLME